MPLDARAKRFLDMIAASGARSGAATIEDERRAFQTLMASAGTPPAAVPTKDIQVAGAAGPRSARLYGPAGEAALPGLVFFHGGGFSAGDLDTHDGVCSQLADSAGCRVLSVAYRLAPEHPFPAAVADAVAAVRAVIGTAASFGMDPQRVAIGGDSVGANLAAVACQRAVPRGSPAIKAQLLICPVLDAVRTGDSHRLFATGHFLDEATLDRQAVVYGGPNGLDPADPRVSPVMAPDLRGLPPALIETAEYDRVRDDGAIYAERLEAAGVPVRYTCHPGMIHLFYGLGRVIPHGTVALREIGRRLAEALA